VVRPGQQQVACLAADGRLLVFPLDELKLQPGGGKGLTLMDVDDKTPLLSVAPFTDVLTVQGSGRGGKTKEEVVKGATLAGHQGKRARKGRKVDGLLKVLRLA
jgi:topoisomerase-4 subunit A